MSVSLLTALAAACAISPEAARARGGGLGADLGNHGAPVQIHGTTNPAHDVPEVGKGVPAARAGSGGSAGTAATAGTAGATPR